MSVTRYTERMKSAAKDERNDGRGVAGETQELTMWTKWPGRRSAAKGVRDHAELAFADAAAVFCTGLAFSATVSALFGFFLLLLLIGAGFWQSFAPPVSRGRVVCIGRRGLIAVLRMPS